MDGEKGVHDKRTLDERAKADLAKKQFAQLQQMKEFIGKSRKPIGNPSPLFTQPQSSSTMNSTVSNQYSQNNTHVATSSVGTAPINRPPPIATKIVLPEMMQHGSRPAIIGARPSLPPQTAPFFKGVSTARNPELSIASNIRQRNNIASPSTVRPYQVPNMSLQKSSPVSIVNSSSPVQSHKEAEARKTFSKRKVEISTFSADSLIPWSPFMTPDSFMTSLIRFSQAIDIKIEQNLIINNRNVHPFALYKSISSFGGIGAVESGQKWPLVANSLQVPLNAIAIARKYYLFYLYPYEQYYLLSKSVENIEILSDTAKEEKQVISEAKKIEDDNDQVGGFYLTKLINAGKHIDYGRNYNINEISLCLKSNRRIEVCFALNALNKISCLENTAVLKRIDTLLEPLLSIFKDHYLPSLKRISLSEMISIRKKIDFRMNEDEEISLSILNILKNWSLQKSAVSSLISCNIFDRMLHSCLLANNFEMFVEACHTLCGIIDFQEVSVDFQIDLIFGRILPHLECFLKPSVRYISFDFRSDFFKDSTEKLKKSILEEMNRLGQYCKEIEPFLYLLLETSTKILAKRTLIVERAEHRESIIRMIHTLIDFIFPLINTIVSICSVIAILIKISPPTSLSWLTLINGNPNFGWPDLGYLELSLSIIYYLKLLLNNNTNDSSAGSISIPEERFVITLAKFCDSSKNLWFKSAPLNTTAWQKSFANSVGSNPFTCLRKAVFIILEYVSNCSSLIHSPLEEIIVNCVTMLDEKHPNIYGQDELFSLFMGILSHLNENKAAS